MKRTCPACETEFTAAVPHQKWCSKRCNRREEARRRLGVTGIKPLSRECWWCDSRFKSADSRRDYCSTRCSSIAKSLREVKRRYGITRDEYKRLYRSQGGECAICRQPERAIRTTLLTVDHDHVTGHVRGLLCSQCNRAIGLLGDDPKVIRRAAEYVQGNRQIKLIVA